MSSRSLIPVLLVAAVVFACNPLSRNEASTPKHDTAQVVQAGAIALATDAPAQPRKRGTSVEGRLYVHATDSAVRLALHVVNAGKKRVELTFPSGQTYDFVIIDSVGREVWRWGKGRMFTQALRNRLLASGETLDVEETFNSARLRPGRYTARGTLTSENFPITETAEFTVEPRTLASRE